MNEPIQIEVAQNKVKIEQHTKDIAELNRRIGNGHAGLIRRIEERLDELEKALVEHQRFAERIVARRERDIAYICGALGIIHFLTGSGVLTLAEILSKLGH